MKHLKALTQGPARAQDPTLGQIIVVVAQIISIIGAALVAKDTQQPSSSA